MRHAYLPANFVCVLKLLAKHSQITTSHHGYRQAAHAEFETRPKNTSKMMKDIQYIDVAVLFFCMQAFPTYIQENWHILSSNRT